MLVTKNVPVFFNKHCTVLCKMCIMVTIGLVLLSSNGLAVSPVQKSSKPANITNTTKTLKLLHVVFRHGNRTPSNTYPKDPYKNETFYPYGKGQLTNQGKHLIFSIGIWLKQQYGNYLGDLPLPDAVWAQATDYPRTIMSTATLLAGLFPPNYTPLKWNKQINWQPIPIIAEPLNEDTLLEVRSPCPRYDEAYDAVLQMPEIKSFLTKNKPLFEELSKFTGLHITQLDDVQFLYDTLRGEIEYGLKLPNWTQQYYPDRLLPIYENSLLPNTYTEELKKLVVGPFIKKMINDWKQKQYGTITPKNRKIFIYGGHDVTVVNILSGLNLWKLQNSDYGIMAIFELLQDNDSGAYGVQIYLRNSQDLQAVQLPIPGCDHFCPLDTFIELYKKVIPINEIAECKAKDTT